MEKPRPICHLHFEVTGIVRQDLVPQLQDDDSGKEEGPCIGPPTTRDRRATIPLPLVKKGEKETVK